MNRAVFITNSPEETRALGRELGRRIEGDPTIALTGALGAGKTCFTQGLGRGLGVKQVVNSPTFVLMKRYNGRLPIQHWDWYRMESEDDLESTGYGDLQVERGITVIEWADRFLECVAKPFLLIKMEQTGAKSRRIEMSVEGRSPQLEILLEEVQQWWEMR